LVPRQPVQVFDPVQQLGSIVRHAVDGPAECQSRNTLTEAGRSDGADSPKSPDETLPAANDFTVNDRSHEGSRNMFTIDFVASRNSDEPIRQTDFPGNTLVGAVALAKTVLHRVTANMPRDGVSVIGYVVRDADGAVVHREYGELS
jgi:hypothetical protein